MKGLKSDQFESFAKNSQLELVSEQNKVLKEIQLPQFYPSMTTIKIFNSDFLKKPEQQQKISVKQAFNPLKQNKELSIQNNYLKVVEKKIIKQNEFTIDDLIDKQYIFSKQDVERFSLGGQNKQNDKIRQLQNFKDIFNQKSISINPTEDKIIQTNFVKKLNREYKSNFKFQQKSNKYNQVQLDQDIQIQEIKNYQIANYNKIFVNLNTQKNLKQSFQKKYFSFIDQNDQKGFQIQNTGSYQHNSKEDSQTYFEEFYEGTQQTVLKRQQKLQRQKVSKPITIISQNMRTSNPLSFGQFQSFVTQTSVKPPTQSVNKKINKVQPKSREFYNNTHRQNDQDLSFENLTQQSHASNLTNLKSDIFKKLLIKKSTLQPKQQPQTTKSDTSALKKQFSNRANKYFEEMMKRTKNLEEVNN